MNRESESSVSSLNAAIKKIAGNEGVAVVVMEDDQLGIVAAANDNSICRILTESDEFAPDCKRYCGQVFNRAVRSPKPLKFRCHAGLDCIAVPVKVAGHPPLVAITGRAFTKADEYRKATERAITGDWRHLPPTRFFENVLLSSTSQALEKAAKGILDLSGRMAESPEAQAEGLPVAVDSEKNGMAAHASPASRAGEMDKGDLSEISEWRSMFSSILEKDYEEAYRSVLEYLAERYGINSSAWLEVRRNSFVKVFAKGELQDQRIQISVAADDTALMRLFDTEASIELKERGVRSATDSDSLRLFPLVTGGAIRSALVIGEGSDDKATVAAISRFCASLAPELEILRLRSELSRREGLEAAMQKFNKSLEAIDTDDFWVRLLQTTAELLQAERGSLMNYDDESKRLVVRTAIGSGADRVSTAEARLGERISMKVWQTAKPAVVEDISKLSMAEAPEDWKYRSKSFISYPLMVGERKIGVLNLTDRAGGGRFEEFDIELLESIAPQIAVAVDRATLMSKAGEFEKLSVTDSLTGLLNRRYLEQRLEEEIKRSGRHNYPMCFMMIDVDDFKSYNDTFLHPEGDKALRIVGNCLKDTLRGADVAVRYGGEEFSVLLPQTSIDEGEIIAERIRRRIESTRFPHRQVTVSIGIATLSLDVNTVEKLIEAADEALFEAKKDGKNKVQTFSGRTSGIAT